MEILDEVKKDFVIDLIRKNKRPDERDFLSYRPITIQKDVLTSTEGSALVKIGNSQVLVGIKMDKGTPFTDRPKEGILATNAELLPLASPTFELGPPDERSIELARVVDRGIRSSSAIDLKSLYIAENLVWAVFIDLYVLDHDGNLIDTAALAAMAALLNTKQPKFEDGKVIRKEPMDKLKINARAVTCTFAKIDGKLVLDPCLDEETAMDARLTIATDENNICAMQKGCLGGFSADEVNQLIGVSFEKGKELRKLIE
ncbi:exosome complex protein Rrp42 [Candidatus Micrarchaeota archaeon]|nr:exosome complex protein Rrp42 [Candidatus Micrarchaeota archaeon]